MIQAENGQSASAPPAHVISVDVEDYFQVEAFADRIAPHTWDRWPSRVVENTRRVLDLFDRHGAQGTFFFLGWVADRFPALVREVASRGHEIACHSYWHRTIYRLTPRQFREDTRAARAVIEQACGKQVLGYRAPTWSITESCLWALEILVEEGFVYDSSIFPIVHDLYGIPHAPRFRYTHSIAGAPLAEFPPATVRLAGRNFPVAGGGYLRLFPIRYTRWALRRYESIYRQPAVVYFHPWEMDRDQPRISGVARSKFRHYTNLEVMEERLDMLLGQFRFQPFRALMEQDCSGDVSSRRLGVERSGNPERDSATPQTTLGREQ